MFSLKFEAKGSNSKNKRNKEEKRITSNQLTPTTQIQSFASLEFIRKNPLVSPLTWTKHFQFDVNNMLKRIEKSPIELSY